MSARPFGFYQFTADHGYHLDLIDGALSLITTDVAFNLDLVSDIDSVEVQRQSIRAFYGEARPVLAGLENLGLLQSGDDIATRMRHALARVRATGAACTNLERPNTESPSIERLVWVTRNRAAQLAEGVLAFGRSRAVTERSLEFIVVDDSDTVTERGKLRTLLAEVSDTLGRPITVLCRDSRRSCLTELRGMCREASVPASVPETLLEGFLPFGSAHGRNRNFAAVVSQGSGALWNDDDILPLYASLAPADGPSVLYSSEFSAHLARSFRTRDHVVAAAGLCEIDFIAEHERLLGPAGAHLPDAESSVSFAGASPDLVRRLVSGKGEVIATCAGVAGEAAGKPPNAYLYWPLTWRGLATESQEEYYAELESGEIVIAAPAPVITDSHFLPGTQCALDFRKLLPPFFPHFVGEDTIFVITLRTAIADSLIGQLPYGVFHNRRATRTHTRSEMTSPWHHFNLLVVYLLSECRRHGFDRSPPEGFRSVGEYVSGLGELPPRAFARLVRDVLARNVGFQRIIHEEMVARTPVAPEWWIRDVRDYEENCLRQLEGENAVIPLEFAHLELQEALDMFQLCLRRYGEVLIHWPTVWEMLSVAGVRGVKPGS